MAASAMGLFGGMLGGAATADRDEIRRPTDAPTIVLYMQGCMTWEELGEVEAAIQRHRPVSEVVVLSPILASREAAMHCALGSAGSDDLSALGLLYAKAAGSSL